MSSYFEKQKEEYSIEVKSKIDNLKYDEDISICHKNNIFIYPYPITSSKYIIKIEIEGNVIDYEEEINNPFCNEKIYSPVEFKKNIRYKKDRCVWKQIRKLYRQYCINIIKKEVNGN